jgi:hypothetical protein
MSLGGMLGPSRDEVAKGLIMASLRQHYKERFKPIRLEYQHEREAREKAERKMIAEATTCEQLWQACHLFETKMISFRNPEIIAEAMTKALEIGTRQDLKVIVEFGPSGLRKKAIQKIKEINRGKKPLPKPGLIKRFLKFLEPKGHDYKK